MRRIRKFIALLSCGLATFSITPSMRAQDLMSQNDINQKAMMMISESFNSAMKDVLREVGYDE